MHIFHELVYLILKVFPVNNAIKETMLLNEL